MKPYLDIDEGGEVQLVTGPLTHVELVTVFLRQSVQELQEKQKNIQTDIVSQCYWL